MKLPRNGVYQVSLEAKSALRLRRELPLELSYIMGDGRRLRLNLETEYDSLKGWPRPILLARALVTGRGLNEATEWTVGYVRSLLNCYAVATNAYVEDAQLTYAFDSSDVPAGAREFIQSQSQIVRQTVPGQTRLIEYEATTEFPQVVMDSTPKARDRLLRAVQQYVLALRYWNLEQRVLAAGHAFMAAEALTPVAKTSLGKSDEQLADLEQADRFIKYRSRGRDIANAADSRARRAVTFHGDARALKAARELSDGYEHGYGDYDALQQLADANASATLSHVRRAIIELSPLSDRLKSALLDVQFDEPLSLFAVHGIFGSFNTEVQREIFSSAPVDTSNIDATVASYDRISGGYNIAVNYQLAPKAPITIREMKVRH